MAPRIAPGAPIRFDIRLKRFAPNCQWVKAPVGEEVTQPDVLATSDECLGKIRNQVKKEKPISFRFDRVEKLNYGRGQFPTLYGFAGIESRRPLLEESSKRLTSVRRADSLAKLHHFVLGSLFDMGSHLTAQKLLRRFECS